MVINGAPPNTAAYRLEGMDNTNHTVSYALQENQPSADAIQEVAVQTSNYAPEFGQAGGGLFNVTMKSGTSQFHGSFYEYFVNEALNAGYGSVANDQTARLQHFPFVPFGKRLCAFCSRPHCATAGVALLFSCAQV